MQKEEEQRRIQEKKAATEERKELELQRRQREVCVRQSFRGDSLCVCVCVCVCRQSKEQPGREQQMREVAHWKSRGQ